MSINMISNNCNNIVSDNNTGINMNHTSHHLSDMILKEIYEGLFRLQIYTDNKVCELGNFTIQQQIHIRHLSRFTECYSRLAAHTEKKKTGNYQGTLYGSSVSQGDSPVPSNTIEDFVYSSPGPRLMLDNSRNPRKSRYIAMLMSTPPSHVINRVHPVTDIMRRIRDPYLRRMQVITTESIEMGI
ncbi:hypothetical protein BDB01DRAFT_815601 [Pilobolus umbonatus]|nr:hypothetical protein BDB01DRAFT_815601 [Pilobolus umbonatus]